MSLKLWLLRHGKPLVAPNTCYGQLDVSADNAHTLQAAQALWAHWQTQQQAAPQWVWCSPLRRTRQMAVALQAQGLSAPLTLKPELAEMNFGAWEGQTWTDIGEQPLTAWTDDFWRRPTGEQRFAESVSAVGESVAQLVERVELALTQAQALARQRAQMAGTEVHMLWVTHAGVIRAVDALLHLRSHFPLQAQDWPVQAPEPGGWRVYELE